MQRSISYEEISKCLASGVLLLFWVCVLFPQTLESCGTKRRALAKGCVTRSLAWKCECTLNPHKLGSGEKEVEIILGMQHLQRHSFWLHKSGFNSGKAITLRMEGELVNNLMRQWIPMPSPPVGGIPCSSVDKKSLPMLHASNAAFPQ